MQHVQHMDAWGGFVVLAYAIFFTACTVGAFSRARRTARSSPAWS